jgi:Asp-tRNA(Asn)/Glu-tRNA(Gln) amidotransferase A subunit family amidase
MEAAGAVLVGALNMGEYAYDFTGENVHDGPSRNPHDTTRMSGGSSGGSGSAVGGGLVPIALGSDTNGSIRVPSSFCGIFGLKPTYGRLSRARSYPFVASFDHLGPFARNVGDLALAYDAMQGPDPEDAASTTRPVEAATPLLTQDIGSLRIRLPVVISRTTSSRRRSKPSPASPRRWARRAPSRSPKPRAPGLRPISSPPPKAPRCISTGCASVRTISIRRCATASSPAQ